MRRLVGRAVVAALVAGAGLVALAPTPVPAVPAAPPAKAFAVTATPAASVWSQAVKLTVAITPKGGGAPLGGTVTFLVDGSPIGTAVATTRNTVLTTTTLPPGEHTVTATYDGDARTAPGTSTAAAVTGAPAPTTLTVAPTQPRVRPGRLAAIKATVRAVAPAAPTRRPTGRVTFTTSCRTASVAVNANGVATWRTPLCPGAPGNRTYRATYTGSDRHAASPQASTTVRLVFPTQDQEAAGDLGPDVPVEGTSSWAQAFTAGRSGQLVDVGFGIARPADAAGIVAPLQVTVQAVDGDGVPTGTVLGSGTVAADAIGPGDARYLTLALDQAAAITSGTRYALVFETTDGRWDLWTTQGDVYPDPLHRDEGAGWTAQPHDLAFTTWVYAPA